MTRAGGRAGYLPAIDGLRGVAVLGVMASHAFVPFDAFGVGVDLFFVISGYLITGILAGELDRTGTVAIGRFYRKRMARLYPALAVVAVVTGVVYFALPLPARSETVLGAGTSLLYLSAFPRMAGDSIGWLGHTWSLSVEQVFYLVWPLVLVGATTSRSLHRRILVATGIALALHLALLPVASPAWLYNGPDSRAIQILAGAALFVLVATDRLGDRLVIGAGLAGTLWFALHVTVTPLGITQGSIVAIAAAGAGVVAVALRFPDAPILSRRELVWVGTRSYSLYLVHYPLFGLHRDDWSPSVDYAVRLAAIVASFGVAELLYRSVEVPFRHRLARRSAPGTSAIGNPT